MKLQIIKNKKWEFRYIPSYGYGPLIDIGPLCIFFWNGLCVDSPNGPWGRFL